MTLPFLIKREWRVSCGILEEKNKDSKAKGESKDAHIFIGA